MLQSHTASDVCRKRRKRGPTYELDVVIAEMDMYEIESDTNTGSEVTRNGDIGIGK